MRKNLVSMLVIGIIVLFFAYYLFSSSGNSTVDSSGLDSELTDISDDRGTSDSGNDRSTANLGEEDGIDPASFQVDDTADLERAEIEIASSPEEEIIEDEVGVESEDVEVLELKETELITETETKEELTPETELRRESLVEKIQIHQVKKGENLWVIAGKYNIDIDTLIGANDIANMNKIKIGDELRILPVKGILYKVNPGESLWTISKQFNISINKIVEANVIDKPDLVQPGVTLILPGAKPEFGYQDRLGKRFIYPVNARISSYFGARWGKQHAGIDFAVNVGTEIKAARAGKIIYSQWSNGYGYTVVIEHQKGVRTLYAHNSKLLVRGGQWVEQGQVISLSGNTGNSTGPHLHFEVQINGQAVNPLNYIEK